MNDSSTTARPASAKSKAARGLLCLVLAGSALAVGTLHTTVLCVVAAVVAVAAALVWAGEESFRPRPVASVLFWVGAALVAYTALQAIPLPAGVVAALAPHTADIWARALTPLGEHGPAFVTLSLDPIATRVEVLRGVTYLAMFIACVRVCSSRHGAGSLSVAIVVTALVVGIAALLHPTFGAQKVYGIYVPGDGTNIKHIAPLLNPNHLAAYLNIGYCLALGAALAPRPEFPRALSAGAVVALAGIQVWVASRGGVGALILASLLVAWFSRTRSRESESSRSLAWAVPGVLCIASVVVMALTSSDALKEISETDTSKLSLIRRAFAMCTDFPLFGVGRGAFESVFPAYRGGHGHLVFTHPENIVAQWASEWGVPFAVAAIAGIAFALRPSSMRARPFSAVGAWVAIAVTAIHNLVDFSSEVPAVVLALVACAAIVTGGSSGMRERTRAAGWGRAPNVVVAGVALASVGAIAVAVVGIGQELQEDEATVYRTAIDRAGTRVAFVSVVKPAMLRHPAEPYFAFAGALRAQRQRDESVMPWIERTLERANMYAPAHLILARALATLSPAQARLEYRLCVEQSPALAYWVPKEAARLVGSFDDAMEVIPASNDAMMALEQVSDAISARLPATRLLVDAEILRRKPDSVPSLLRRASDVLADLDAGPSAPWCESARAECAKHGLSSIERARALQPQDLVVQLLHAKLLVASGDTRRGLDDLAAACESVDKRSDCFMNLVALAREMHDEPRATAALERLSRAGCDGEEDCQRIIMYLASTELDRGNNGTALGLYKKALARAPDDEALLERVASLSAKLGLHAEALDLYTRLAVRQPGDPRWSEAVGRERSAAMNEKYRR